MSPLQQRIEADMIAAMKEKKQPDLTVVRQLRSALKNAEIDEGGELSDEAVLKVVQREFKKLNDSLNDFTSAGRDDLAAATASEIEIVKKYLPTPLSTEELRAIVQKVYDTCKENGQAIQKGPLMGMVMKEVGARAQGNDVASLIDEIIS